MNHKERDLAQLSIDTIRTLSIDAVQKANSGHPGTPMALAPVVYVLWQEFLNFNPQDALWPNRDRFILSCGHASMVLYSVIHLSGVKAENNSPAISLEDIKNFRQLGSKCPGHPEYRVVPGVEATTGPLGQGIANSVGMAMAERWQEAHFNQADNKIFDYSVYAVCSDGDMMEGISEEAASLAGHLKLSNLCWIYDNNHISLAGKTNIIFDEDVEARFISYGWKVTHVYDANDLNQIRESFKIFKATQDRPTLIILNSHIGYGSPHKQDSHEAHGSPLGEEEVKLTKRFYGWPEDEKFLVPALVLENFNSGIVTRGAELCENWQNKLSSYAKKYPQLSQQIQQMLHQELPAGWDTNLPFYEADAKGKATRESSGEVLNKLAENIPWLMGGAADLGPSTKTTLKFESAGDFQPKSYGGRNIHYGVREHAMGAISNGLTLSNIRAYNATFLIFSDYQKPPIRLSALMEIPTIYIYTHDSISLGEDGPTHQPVEQLVTLRAVPKMIVLRPADANEVTECWRVIMKLKKRPAALVLSRQNLPTLDRSTYASAQGAQNGAYILAADEKPQVLLIATGSEVHLCTEAYKKLKSEGIRAQVISMPSWELFEEQDSEYRDKVLPPNVSARVAVEEGSVIGWERYVGQSGVIIGMKTFGASAPEKDLLKHFGFTVDHVVEAARHQIWSGK